MKRIRKQVGKDSRAFTIIEVVLVLAVAGLIFLVVFSAIPRLQASRRDNQRKRDAEALFAAIIDFQSNTGNLPADGGACGGDVFSALSASPSGVFLPYLPLGDWSPPEGGDYLSISGWTNYDASTSRIVYCSNRECTTNGTRAGALQGSIAVLMSLERGSYCIDSA